MSESSKLKSMGLPLVVGIFALVLLIGSVLALKFVGEYFHTPAYPFKENAASGLAGAGSGGAGSGHGGLVSVAAGKGLYSTYCIACHQAEGMGKVGFAPFIRNRDFLALASDDYLRTSIIAGRPGTAMPSWAHLKAHEVDSLVAYLRHGSKSAASVLSRADPKKKYDGNSDEGKPLYATYCASCHGENGSGYGEGGPGPGIGNAGFLAVASDDFIFQTIKHGRTGTAMLPFVGAKGLAGLDESQVGNIVAYLRELGNAAPATPIAEKAGAGDSKSGEMHFAANCAACHQPDGAGLPGFAPSIRNSDFLAIASDQFIKDAIQKGRPGTTMIMRPDLSEQTIADIIAFLRTVPEGATSKIKVDPTKDLASLGDDAKGLTTFNIYCASCHGESGKGYIAGGPGSGIGLKGFLDAASDDYIFQTLKLGRSGTPMRPFIGATGLANLSEEDAYDIIAYLRSLK